MERKALPQDFADRVAVVTGAARGIGRAIAENLRGRGAHLILVDRDAAGMASLAAVLRTASSLPVDTVEIHRAEIHRAEIHTIGVDLSSAREVEELIPQVARLTAQVDVLVNNAGIETDLPMEKVTAQFFDQIMATNLRAPFLVSQGLVPLFPAAGGAIVNISSIHASHAFPDAIPYACSKAGLLALTRNLALELAGRKIRVNAVLPGYIDTAMWEQWLRTVDNPEEVSHQTAALHPLGRRGLPMDVAEAVAYLAGPHAEWITGTHLVVDGGLTIRAHP
jgi:NAD(P)-dependent dehydrogenase (short-subunit alcohol dehydrogenase family)